MALQETTTLSPDVYARVEQDAFEIRSKLDPSTPSELAKQSFAAVTRNGEMGSVPPFGTSDKNPLELCRCKTRVSETVVCER